MLQKFKLNYSERTPAKIMYRLQVKKEIYPIQLVRHAS